MRDEIESRLEAFTGSAAQMLENHLRYFYARIMSDEKIPPLIAMVLGEGNRFPSLTEFFFRTVISRSQHTMRTIIERGVASGEFRRTEVATYTQIVIAPALISALWKLQFEKISPIDLNTFADTHIDIILNGLLADPL